MFLIQALKISGLGSKVIPEIQKALDTTGSSQMLSGILDNTEEWDQHSRCLTNPRQVPKGV